jgi:two-component system chemotaxis response regulator CheY
MSGRILAVDDSASMRQMVAFTLKSAGFDVAEAEDGQAALDLAKTEKFKLVLADVNMPRMDGITLVRNLRGMADYKFTPLLMLTTESTPEKKMEGKAAGATGWLVKPFNPEQLVATVQRVLG